MHSSFIKLATLHLMAVILLAGCMLSVDFNSGRALFLFPAGMLALVVAGTLKDLFFQMRQALNARG